MAYDLGFTITLHLFTDATAAIGICRRRGLGRIRHLSTSDLWIQERLRNGEFQLSKIPGAENPADLLTKHVDGPTIQRLLPLINLEEEHGRPDSAPRL